MLPRNGQYPDLKLPAILLKLAIDIACSPFLTAPKFPSNRNTLHLTLVTPKNGG
jgi:hypothetical protein